MTRFEEVYQLELGDEDSLDSMLEDLEKTVKAKWSEGEDALVISDVMADLSED